MNRKAATARATRHLAKPAAYARQSERYRDRAARLSGRSREEYDKGASARAEVIAINRNVSRRALQMYYTARSRAGKRGLPFTITAADVEQLMVVRCPVLGLELTYGDMTYGSTSASLDRVNCALGYVPGNVCIISGRANTLKNNADLDELRALVRYVESHTMLLAA